MAQTFFWYDLETTGTNPREGRIMQFAGQRTDMDLNSVGDSFNLLVKLTDDVLPEPDAIMVTGLTPQMTLADGISELEFLKLFYEQVAVPGTIFAGYNSVRFDDEFIRFLNWRNFYDAYQWQWQENRGKWDLLDVVRMTRALRPDGIKWPFDSSGKPSNRLELLTSVNGLDHANAHDALSDVTACIAVARLIRTRQPKLFDWLLKVRGKKDAEALVGAGEPFVYTSGRYSGEFEKTTVVIKLADPPNRSGALVYDLRYDPTEFLGMKPEELAGRWQWTRDETAPPRLPIKTLHYNRCPAVAPLSVLNTESQVRLKLDLKQVQAHRTKVLQATDFVEKLYKALDILADRPQTSAFADQQSVDGQLYEGLLDNHDCDMLAQVRAARPDELAGLAAQLHDNRLQQLLPLYKARNYPKSLSSEERQMWESYRLHRLTDGGENSRLGRYMKRLQQLAETETGGQKRYLLEELQLYAESIVPTDIA